MPSPRHRTRVPIPIVAVLVAFWALPANAQTCFDYVDGCSRPAEGWTIPFPLPNCVNAKVPLQCVQKGPLAATGALVPCSWEIPIPGQDFAGDCHEDGDPSDCCTSVTSPNTQAILQMHTAWHNCFGNVGDSDGNNPPGRGQRWYAFHRQFELDFTLWRETAGFGFIQSLEWCPGMNMPIGHPSGGWPSSGAGLTLPFAARAPAAPTIRRAPTASPFRSVCFGPAEGPLLALPHPARRAKQVALLSRTRRSISSRTSRRSVRSWTIASMGRCTRRYRTPTTRVSTFRIRRTLPVLPATRCSGGCTRPSTTSFERGRTSRPSTWCS